MKLVLLTIALLMLQHGHGAQKTSAINALMEMYATCSPMISFTKFLILISRGAWLVGFPANLPKELITEIPLCVHNDWITMAYHNRLNLNEWNVLADCVYQSAKESLDHKKEVTVTDLVYCTHHKSPPKKASPAFLIIQKGVEAYIRCGGTMNFSDFIIITFLGPRVGSTAGNLQEETFRSVTSCSAKYIGPQLVLMDDNGRQALNHCIEIYAKEYVLRDQQITASDLYYCTKSFLLESIINYRKFGISASRSG